MLAIRIPRNLDLPQGFGQHPGTSWQNIGFRLPARKLKETVHQLSTHAPAACLKMSRTREAPTPTKSSMNSEAEAWISFELPTAQNKQGRKRQQGEAGAFKGTRCQKETNVIDPRSAFRISYSCPSPNCIFLFALALRAKDIRQLNTSTQ